MAIQNDDYKIITDEPAKDVPDFKEYAERLSQIIVKSKPLFTVGIFGGWGTGKTTMLKMINNEIETNYSEIATTIWFDSWRYEREKYSLMIPLLRTIILTLHDVIKYASIDSEMKKTLGRVQSGFVKMMKAVARGTGVNLGAEAGTVGGKVSAGLSLDFAKILDEYSSEGHAYVNQEKIFFHKHVSDYLKEEFDGIKNKHRLVIFIDDLDRCTPEGALEILESIKTFFDIEGIIYVIGMDPSTIDSIIQVKYGKNSKISGLDYMQKIVQLPFQIPVWSDEDLGRMIEKIANETGLPKEITDNLLEQELKDLIINSARLNPRNIKRFINSLVLSYTTSGESIKVVRNEGLRSYIIENYLRSMISIQTFYFRGEKWLRLLKMINNYYVRVEFLTHFITVVKSNKISYQDLQDKIKEFPPQTLKIYNEIVEMHDEDLFSFLKDVSTHLLRIDKIENYIRSVDTKNTDTTKSIKLKSYETIDKLGDGIESFNEYIQGYKIHLPYLNLRKIFNLRPPFDPQREEILLSGAKLGGANLLGAKLLGAILAGADLSEAILVEATLIEADLSGAILAGADLSGASLNGANLTSADLLGANLTSADLSGARLSEANLSEANLSEANLSEANLSGANLSEANLSGANISNTIIIELGGYENLKLDQKSNLIGAICDRMDFIYHVSKFILPENIPKFMNNKKELKSILKRRIFNTQHLDSLLKISRLPE